MERTDEQARDDLMEVLAGLRHPITAAVPDRTGQGADPGVDLIAYVTDGGALHLQVKGYRSITPERALVDDDRPPLGFGFAHPVVIALDLAIDASRGREIVAIWDSPGALHPCLVTPS